MIWSFEGFFPFVIEFASAFYFAICIILLFLDVPKTEEYLPYRKAKKCMTASYFILGCNLLAWLILTKGGIGTWNEGLNVYVKLSDFLFFYMGMFCFAGAFCYLVDPRYFTPARKKRNVAIFAGALFLMLLSVYFDAYDFSAYFTALAFVTFFVHLVVYLSSTISMRIGRRYWRITSWRICCSSCFGSRRVSSSWFACISWDA